MDQRQLVEVAAAAGFARALVVPGTYGTYPSLVKWAVGRALTLGIAALPPNVGVRLAPYFGLWAAR